MNQEYAGYLKPIRTALIVLLIVGSLFLLAETVTAINSWSKPGERSNIPAITVNGTADVFLVPDVATFSFTVSEQGATVKEAQDKATQKTNAAIDYVKKQGIDEKDIKTINYNANPKYEYQQAACRVGGICPPGKQVLVGYEVSQTIQVKVRKTDQAGTILAGIGALNVQYVSGLQFTVDDENAVMEQAREKAIADAKAKAVVLARDLGVRLVRIMSFNDIQNKPYFYEYDMGRGAAAAPSATPNVPAGQNKYTSNITITYEIR